MPETETPQTENLSLPLLPLTTGVVLPQMVVTLALETAEARDAADGAIAGDRRVLLVPARRHRATPGSARSPGSRTRASCPAASAALVLRGLPARQSAHRRRSDQPGALGRSRAGRRAGRPSPGRAKEMVREYRAVVRGIAREARHPAHRRRARRASTTRARSPTPPAGRPTCRSSARSSCSRSSTPKRGSRSRCAWRARRWPSSSVGSRSATASPRAWTRRSASSCCASSSPRSARSWARRRRRRRRGRRVPQPPRASRGCPTTCAPRSSARSTGSSARASRAPSTAGSARGSTPCSSIPWGTRSDEHVDVAEAARDPRRRPHRARRREGPHRRVPRGAQAARRARHERPRRASHELATVERRGRGRDPRAGRSSRRRQDVARRVGRPRARARVRACRPRRRARRGRAPRSPAHVRRRAARAASCAR